MAPEVLALDLDGPILDVSAKYHRVYALLVEKLGGRPLPKDVFWDLKRTRLPDDAILARSGVEGGVAAFRREREELIETPPFLALDACWPGIAEALHAASERRELVLVTLRRSRRALEEQLERLGLSTCFAHVLSDPGEGDRAGTKTRLVREALGPARRGCFVGDTETDIRAGRELGFKTVGVTFGIRASELLRAERPDVVLGSPEELVGFLSRA